ncbi:MAG TPA: hypothetical protein VFE98_01045 [Candidatus Bathyarchaeia archaeon]|nr:hypothetical protein [Candidatus Bathyarchaeia archaeon]
MSSFQLSKIRLAIYAQSAVNVLLALWLYDEYVHNVFMQQYLSNLWGSIGTFVAVGALVTAILVVGLVLYKRKIGISLSNSTEVIKGVQADGEQPTLKTMDTCPFCNSQLRSLSNERFQCRKCKRYFKK